MLCLHLCIENLTHLLVVPLHVDKVTSTAHDSIADIAKVLDLAEYLLCLFFGVASLFHVKGNGRIAGDKRADCSIELVALGC